MISVQDLLQRWRPSQLVGCDVGSRAVKVVQLLRTKDRTVLVQHGIHDVDWESAPEQAKADVTAFLRTMEVPRNKSGLNLPYSGLSMRPVALARMPDRDLRLALRWNFRKEIEGPLENLQIEYTEIAKPVNQERRALMAYGIDKTVLDQRRVFAQDCGLRLATLEPTPSALLAAFAHSVPMPADHCFIVVDVGFERGTCMVFGTQSVLWVRELPGVSLQQLAVGLLPAEATIAAQRAIVTTVLQGGLTDQQDQSLREFYRQWLVEIQRALDTFVAENKKEGTPGLTRLYLCGGGALLPEITQVAHKNLGVEAVVWDPFAGIVDTKGNPASVPNAPLYASAVGLAMPQRG